MTSSSPDGSPAGSPAGSGDERVERLPRPPAFAYPAQTWKEISHLLLNLPLGVFGFVYALMWLAVGVGMAVTIGGLPVLALGLLGSRWFARCERSRARTLLALRVDEPSRMPRGLDDGFFSWLWRSLRDPVGWRATLYAAIRLPWGILTFTLTLTSLFIAWPVLPWIARALTNVDRVMVRGLLSPSDELERRIAELESDRGTVVDTAAADLRRIERDLHDGAQARLVALAMDLGLAKEKLDEDPQAAARMVDEAHGEVKLALQELRDLARGIHPAILTDRGLGPALSALAARCTVPVTVTVDLPQRPAPAIEGIAYFTVSELLQNISKHSHAHTADVSLSRSGSRLLIGVRDDGRGGAAPAGGGGLAGLAERIEAVDGRFTVASPPGGPTSVDAELPWRDRDGTSRTGGVPRPPATARKTR
ncbi:sensor histidine kinase [Streptomyces sp. NPDC021098]|uniref:sensor histidine kinase n=1 Tax=unclassified Streptomyces TaxID=2593676 RepID=UPI0037BA0E0E